MLLNGNWALKLPNSSPLPSPPSIYSILGRDKDKFETLAEPCVKSRFGSNFEVSQNELLSPSDRLKKGKRGKSAITINKFVQLYRQTEEEGIHILLHYINACAYKVNVWVHHKTLSKLNSSKGKVYYLNIGIMINKSRWAAARGRPKRGRVRMECAEGMTSRLTGLTADLSS